MLDLLCTPVNARMMNIGSQGAKKSGCLFIDGMNFLHRTLAATPPLLLRLLLLYYSA
jgi:hypothetical protein